MTLEQLRGFWTVAQEGSFSRAAKRMFVTQPAISMQIRALEDELEVALFDRNGRQISLTEAGRILQRHAVRVFDTLNHAEREITELQGMARGHLTIGCSDTLSTYVLPSVLGEYLRMYPGIEITVHNKTSPEVCKMVVDHAIDLGLATLPVHQTKLDVRSLLAAEDRAICSADHPLAAMDAANLRDLVQYRLLLLEPGSRTRQLLDRAFEGAGSVPEQVMELGSIEVLKTFAEVGLGVAIVPAFAVRAEVASGRLCAIPICDLAERPVGVVVRQGGTLSLAATAFLEMLTTSVFELG